MEALNISEAQIWDWLNNIPDPEIPVISIVELGVVRKIELQEDTVIVYITPTYSGCPAMHVFEQDILKKLKAEGIENPVLRTQWSPPWTTEWMNDTAREKLRAHGIAPPVRGSADKGVLFQAGPKIVACPHCGSKTTALVSQFGATACKALYSCNSCKEPFEYFKCI